jgi:hypothetical protein
MGKPFTSHWYTGLLPPFTQLAVKVTDCPGHGGFGDAVIVAVTGIELSTCMVMAFETPGFPMAQLRLDVNSQVMTAPSAGA